MNGARKYAEMFETKQHGQLYLVSHHHARGKTFHIFVLPEGEQANPNGPNAPLNANAVEVYGIVDGKPGWTESYGWLHRGKWCDDFAALVKQRDAEIAASDAASAKLRERQDAEKRQHVTSLLAAY